jgi:hypothetical protein
MSQSVKVAVIGLVACLSIAAAAKSALPSTGMSADGQKPTIAMRAKIR